MILHKLSRHRQMYLLLLIALFYDAKEIQERTVLLGRIGSSNEEVPECLHVGA